MTVPPAPTLADWFEYISAAGLRAGVRERMLAHALLIRLALRGQLPEAPVERWRLLGPLLCSSPQQQRDYARMLDELAGSADQGASAAALPQAGLQPSSERAAWTLWGSLIAVLVCLLALWWWWPRPDPVSAPEPVSPVASAPQLSASGVAPTVVNTAPSVAEVAASAIPQSVYVPQRPLGWAVPVPPAWAVPLRTGLAVLGGLALLFIGWRVWRRLKLRRPYLEAQEQSDAVVEQRLLRDCEKAEQSAIGPATDVIVPVVRGLRQRIDGDRPVLDVRATIAATIRQGGRVLLPVWRMTQQTPEYLALVERAGEGDHQAQYHEAVVEALRARGVTVDLYFYRQSPEHGCWRLTRAGAAGTSADESRLAHGRVSVTTLLTRFPKHRLLVFGDAAGALDPDTGQPERWTTAARLFPQRAWFTPLPVANWGRAERWVSDSAGLDMLLLPMEDAALGTLTDWLASGRASLIQHPQAPYRYPPLLHGDELEWASRRVAPPPEVLERLLRELRSYLGPKRMRWLAACAVFPALAWPLTLRLGREVEFTDDTEFILGVTTLGALPWFRYGRLPNWLREPLLSQMSPADDKKLREFLKKLLDQVVTQSNKSDHPVLALISRLRHWLRTAHNSEARDLLLIRFLEPAPASRLAQRLPDVFKRWLFRDGSVLRGLRPQVEALALLPLLVGAMALPGLWERIPLMQDAVPVQEWAVESGPIRALALSPDGLQIATLGAGGGTQPKRWWSASGRAVVGAEGWQPAWPSTVAEVQRRPDGVQTAAVLGNVIILATGSGSDAVSIQLKGHSANVLTLAYSPDARWLASADGAGQIIVWDAVTGKLARLLAQTQVQWLDVAWSGDSNRVVAAGSDGTVQIWDSLTGDTVAAVNAPLPPDTARISRLAADGSVLFATGANGQVLRWGAPQPQSVAVLGCDIKDAVPRVDDIARTVANRLTRDTAAGFAQSLPALAAVAYTPAAWQEMRYGAAIPKYGQILVPAGSKAAQDAAQQLATWLGAQTSSQAWVVTIQPDLGAGQLVFSACNLSLPVSEPRLTPVTWPQAAPDTARQSRLDGALNSLFSTSHNARMLVLRKIIAEGDLVSDLVPMVLRRAQRLADEQPRLSSDIQMQILDVLPLLQSAQPVTLQRYAQDIYQLLDYLKNHVDPTAWDKYTQALRAQLLSVQGRAPMIYLKIADEAQRPGAEKLQEQLIKSGISVAGVELVGDKAPDRTALYVHGRSDQNLARSLAGIELAKVGQSSPSVVWQEKVEDSVDTYEMWWPKVAQVQVGQVFKDCDDCPELVLLPMGSFMMGSPSSENDRSGSEEGPVHRVTISQQIAVGKYEVSRKEFSKFVAESNYMTDAEKHGGCLVWGGLKGVEKRSDRNWRNPGFEQSDDHPVVCVSWNDAKAYLNWLNGKIDGKNFRLLNEAEWEYAARAGKGLGRFPWGNDQNYSLMCFYANGVDKTVKEKVPGTNDWKAAMCSDGYAYTAPDKALMPNDFGLYHMHGNAREWVEDVWHANYVGAPDDGSVWGNGGDAELHRVLRGGSWYDDPKLLRSASRTRYVPNHRDDDIGFRIGRNY